MSVVRVAVAGATGLVGRAAVAALLAHPEQPRVLALVRDPARAGLAAAPRLDVVRTDYADLGRVPGALAVDAVICALGTTIRKAGSQAAFRCVDHDHVVALARHARAGGARAFVLVTALGADPRSAVFYNRVKGEVEQSVAALGYPSLTILRPSLLLGPRDEFRLGEELARRLGRLLVGRYRPVAAEAVARAAADAAIAVPAGLRVLESDRIRRVAAG